MCLPSIQLSSKHNNKLRNHLCNFKDKRLKVDEAGLVYKFNCNDCSSSSLCIGDTGRLRKEIFNKHKKKRYRKKKT